MLAKDTEKLEEDQHEAFDKYLSAKVCILQGDNLMYGKVKQRKRDSDG